MKKPLIHCPKDCQHKTYCFRGRPLPNDKNVCYKPEREGLETVGCQEEVLGSLKGGVI